MSRWLQNVGQFLEQLDDQAEKVADERLLQDRKKDDDIASILAARGLEDDDGDDNDHLNDEEDSNDGADDDDIETNEEQGVEPIEEDDGDFNPEAWPEHASSDLVNEEQQVDDNDEAGASVSDSQDPREECVQESAKQLEEGLETKPWETPLKQSPDISESTEVPADHSVEPETTQTSQFNMAPFRATGGSIFSNIKSHLKSAEHLPLPSSESSKQLRDLQKEAKTLKRHVVKLNSQLEHAETEIQAQREELERAAERMEKDRVRYQQEKEAEKKRHADEVQLLKTKHEQALEDAKSRSNSQLEEARRQLRDLEQRRMQEGGDMNKELSDAVQREQEFMQKIALLEDEKTTFMSQIDTLQAQQEALGSRLESLTQTADNAMAREREAEDRLDEALSLHARQISQRNNREAELEKTVSELGAALVEAKATLNPLSSDRTAENSTNDIFQQALAGELEALEAQLEHEKQKCDMLQRELRALTRERTDEVSLTTTQQIEYDRKFQEMSNEIARLKRELRELKEVKSAAILNLEDTSEIKTLSEDLFRQRELVISCKSEISTLKSRLKAAVGRAEKAEESLETLKNVTDTARDVELGTRIRRRGRLKKESAGGFQASMSSALFLNSAQGEASRRLGKSLDALDSMLTQSGTVLRYNPVARLFFSKLITLFTT